jgi:hypothetical protein
MDTPFPWSPRRQSAHHPSPLGPTPTPVSILERRPVLGLSMTKHLPPPVPSTPSPSSPRTPLAFLSNSASTSLSSLSSTDTLIRTPRTSFSSPSSPDMRLPDFASISRIPNYTNDGTVSVPKPHKPSISSSLSSIHENGVPSLMDRLTYLQTGPPSPPIVIPSARLLELPPNRNPDHKQSIASPFVNLNANAYSYSPTSVYPFPLAARQRERRSSSLANELTNLHLDDLSPKQPQPRRATFPDDPPVPAPRQ